MIPVARTWVRKFPAFDPPDPRRLVGRESNLEDFRLYPVIGMFRLERNERWYYTLMMSTGITFGTISALYGLSRGIVTQGQYSFLVAVVIASAVVPTLIAGMFFLPKHLLPRPNNLLKAAPRENGISEEG